MSPISVTTLCPAAIRRAALSLCATFVALLSASASYATVAIDQMPLVVPQPIPPNIMFILDDSGSMDWNYMPDSVPSMTSGPNIRYTAYPINTLYYNPHITYQPWVVPSGMTPYSEPLPSSVSGGTTASKRFLTGSVDLTTQNRCFHVPKEPNNPSFNLRNGNNYYRWRLNSDGTANRCDARAVAFCMDCTNDTSGTGGGCDDNSGCVAVASFSWDLPNGTTITRTIAEERQNYANWYHFYRTRMKMAKAGVSRAFVGLGEDFRVGFRTIHNRTALDIPVGNDNGLFSGDNRQTWFSRLFGATAGGGTPLRRALEATGNYYMRSDANGPYGPESGSAQLSCRRNFAILTTDGYWNGSDPVSADVAANNDNLAGPEIEHPDGTVFQYQPERPFLDSQARTLADVAMYYWKHDLRTEEYMRNNVPVSAGNPAFWQHMVTFGISIGLRGTLDPDTALDEIAAGTRDWPDPHSGSADRKIDDLWHAAVNSRGEFIVAANPAALEEGLTNALKAIEGLGGSGAGLNISDESIAGSLVFQTLYYSGNWHGDVQAFSFNTSTGTIGATPEWSALEELPAHNLRNIRVNTGTALRALTWANLTATQQAALGNSVDVMNYIRGARDKEIAQGGTLRDREQVLGSFINSRSEYVGAPSDALFEGRTFLGATSYPAFATANSARPAVLFAGGNDGMLHAFRVTDKLDDASNVVERAGTEMFAFVPAAAFDSGLGTIADPAFEHRYFVDGRMATGQVYSATPSSPVLAWRTVLIGTMGRGARAVYALDITDPENIQLLWEKTAAQIPELGNVIGDPVIAQIADGDWRVLLPNGPNGSDGESALVMIKIGDGAVDVIPTGATGNNGLTGITAGDTNGNGFVDTVYGGDLLGNVWRFTDLDSTQSLGLLFTARNAANQVQPISAAPYVAVQPVTLKRWVFFGTGRYLNQADLTDTTVQSWYGLIDSGTTITDRATELVQRTIQADGETEASSGADMEGKQGWYVDFVESGARMLVSNRIMLGGLFGTVRIPDSSDPCEPEGTGFTLAISPFSGARLTNPMFLSGRSIVRHTSGPNEMLFYTNEEGETFMLGTYDSAARESFRLNNPPGGGGVAGWSSWREIVR
ncbi:pilus assembly protein [Pseudothauera lacus]|uniref:PilY1 beta-propeller domain-containing protein n=1 Tax=Pseudothauera lacus TaxID=2136175 RepID=A0A2T4IHD1_9RHOO|nr:PilC/PilY family type IV pilus protein [Pseudothauera lacus]PTD97188.1 hypothetical protein C8261_03980 [Pseudothauera lacus]